ncbi:MAG: hypothetical protein ACO3EE_08200 [Flavobacteriales bacterium]
MIVGLIEIMPLGHYTLLDSITRIYLSNPNNSVVLFINEKGSENVSALQKDFGGRLIVKSRKENEDIASFLNQIAKENLDAAYIVTLEKYFTEFNNTQFHYPLYFVVHNVESWFSLSIKNSINHFFEGVSKGRNIAYLLKSNFIYPLQKKKFIKKLIASNSTFVLLNDFLRDEILSKNISKKVISLPFSVYYPKLHDQQIIKSKIRITIPGIVDNNRRDYASVLRIFDEEKELFKNFYELELLGPLKKTESNAYIIQKIAHLNQQGLTVLSYPEKYIPLEEYDHKLAQADLILGNLNVSVNKYSTYGKTKESGTAFAMIRVAKPGLLPSAYQVMDEVKSCTVSFKSYDHLKEILIDFTKDKEKLKILNDEAEKNALKFSPENIYKGLFTI